MSNATRAASFKRLTTIDGHPIWQLRHAPNRSAFFFDCGASIDADGAPNAYGPPGTPNTLDNLASAGHPGNWWGLVTDKHGNPVVQNGVAPAQPYRGLYISQTTLYNDSFGVTDVRRWVDATKIPYVALPWRDLHSSTGLTPGDHSLLINALNGKFVHALYADSKGHDVIGEISICAADALDVPSDARSGGVGRGIFTLVFPKSSFGQGTISDAHTIDVCGRMTLHHFSVHRDKDSTLAQAYPEYPLFTKALEDAGYEV